MRNKYRDSVAILDLDGQNMIIDTTQRAAVAAQRVQEKLGTGIDPNSNEYKSAFYGTDVFYDEKLLELDRLHPHAIAALEEIRQQYVDLYILTSRPDFLGRQTVIWLHDHGIVLAHNEIRFKLYKTEEDKREQFVSTPAWKSIIVHEASWIYQTVLFVDDEMANRQAVKALKRANITVLDSLVDFADDSPIIL